MDVGEQAGLELLTKGWDGLLAGHGRGLLEAALSSWLSRQRWFGAKTRTITKAHIAHWVEIPITAASEIVPLGAMPPASTLGDALLLVHLSYADGSEDRYQVPLAFATEGTAGQLQESFPGSVLLAIQTPTGEAVFHDATMREELRQAFLGLIEHERTLPVENSTSASTHVAATLVAAHESRPAHEIPEDETRRIADAIQERHSIEITEVAPEFAGHMPGASDAGGTDSPVPPETGANLRGYQSAAFSTVRGTGALSARVSSAEQSNTNVIYGQRMIMKVFRRLQPGLNPDVEIGRFLTEIARFPRIAPFLGEITLEEQDGRHTTLAMLQGLVANEGDGWEWTLGELDRFYDSGDAETYAEAAAVLGQRTAEMHLALATATDDAAFAAEAFTIEDLMRDSERVERQISTALDALQAGLETLNGAAAAQAKTVLAQRETLLQRAYSLTQAAPSGERIRIHGDYHLGQVLRTQDDFVLLDFEGEPARSLEERRQKQSPLRDVAGMLRSFSYAAYSWLDAAGPERRQNLTPKAQTWEKAVSAAFLERYYATARAKDTLLPESAQTEALLSAYLLEKALYELLYELNNRPAWIGIPLAGILAL